MFWSDYVTFLFEGFICRLVACCIVNMASLKSGVLIKLLEEMNLDEKGCDEGRKPVLLQIRSIIPVLEEGNLWPNRGFYLKVSDFTHAIFVCLPQEQNEMILSNKLKLGQFIYVQKLEPVSPVPMLKGIALLPGRHPCEGTPEDIFPSTNLLKFLEQSDTEAIVEKGVISEKEIVSSSSYSQKLARGSSDSEVLMRKKGEKRGFEASVRSTRTKRSSVDNDSDSDCSVSSVSSPLIRKRRSWTESEFLAVKEIFDSSVAKKKTRPLARSRSANVSPVRSTRYDSSDDNLSIPSRRRDVCSAQRLVKSSSKSNIPASTVKCEDTSCPVAICSLVEDKRGAETRVSWDSLPSSLVKLGKEVIKQRDVALLAAIEVLQEASASERLIRCLSTFSEFQLADADSIQLLINKFLNFQEDLAHTKLIMQSLTNITPLRTSNTETTAAGTVKEVLKLAIERKKNASSWIKSAVAVDLSPYLNFPKSTVGPTTASKKSSPAKPKGACIVKTQRKSVEIPFLLSSEKDEQQEWARGSTLWASADLAAALQDECRRWFLGYLEKYLDEVESRASTMESGSHMLSGMMYKMKRVNDWLDMIMGSKENCCSLSEFETEACGRIRDKIYGILLKHVARTAMALENMNGNL